MRPTISRSIRPFAGLAGLLLIASACTGSGGASTAPTIATSPLVSALASPAASPAVASAAAPAGGRYGGGGDGYGSPAASGPAASTAAGGETYEVTAATGAVGSYLTGEGGKTLYTFKPDSANTSTCTDGCAAAWPAFTASAQDTLKAGAGVSGKLTTFARPDGTMQVAYNGTPLYYFSGDTKAGETNGQGVGGKWFVTAP